MRWTKKQRANFLLTVLFYAAFLFLALSFEREVVWPVIIAFWTFVMIRTYRAKEMPGWALAVWFVAAIPAAFFMGTGQETLGIICLGAAVSFFGIYNFVHFIRETY